MLRYVNLIITTMPTANLNFTLCISASFDRTFTTSKVIAPGTQLLQISSTITIGIYGTHQLPVHKVCVSAGQIARCILHVALSKNCESELTILCCRCVQLRNVGANLCVDTKYRNTNERFGLEPCTKDNPGLGGEQVMTLGS